jgi:epoxyqueuosine reductase
LGERRVRIAKARGSSPLTSTFIAEFIDGFLAVPENNIMGPGAAGKAWDGFLVGFSSGADELYPYWKDHIGDFHWTPAEAFALGTAMGADIAPAAPVRPEELTVVSFALCQTEETKAANRAQTKFPAEQWARARMYGQQHSIALQKALVAALTARGYPAVVPALLPECGERESPSYGQASTWSERHVAYTSGLGTFGLSGGLITQRGIAVRLGSLIVRASIPATPHPYTDPFAYCLHYHGRAGCTACADRCPVGSVDEAGRDKPACAKHLDPGTREYVRREYGFNGYGCGMCQTGVPCESGIPEGLISPTAL